MAMLALFSGSPIPFLIAIFIAYAGLSEARQVDMIESVRGLTIRDAMIVDPTAIPMDASLAEIAEIWSGISTNELPVVSHVGIVTGMLRLSDLSKAIEKGMNTRSTAGLIANHGILTVTLDDRPRTRDGGSRTPTATSTCGRRTTPTHRNARP